MCWNLWIAFTDGIERRRLLTLWTTDTGVYATVPGDQLHSSYHVDGRRHIAGPPTKDSYNRRFYPPLLIRHKHSLAQAVGVEELHAVTLRNEPLHFGHDSSFPSMGEKKGLVWHIDGRALEANTTHEVRVGVVGTGGRGELDRYVADVTRDGTWPGPCRANWPTRIIHPSCSLPVMVTSALPCAQ